MNQDRIKELVKAQIIAHATAPAQVNESLAGDITKKIVLGLGALTTVTGAIATGGISDGLLTALGGAGITAIAAIAAKVAVDNRIFNRLYKMLIDTVEHRDELIKTILKAPADEQDERLEEFRKQIETLTRQMSRAADKMNAFIKDPSNEATMARLNNKEQARLEIFMDAAAEGRLTTIEKQLMKLNRKIVTVK